MTKRLLKLVITVLIIGTVIFSINKCQEVKEEKQKEAAEVSWYEFTVSFFNLNTYYERLEDGSFATDFYPTEVTQDRVARWKLAADVLPIIEYPEDLISENKWVEAYDMLGDLLIEYDEYYESKDGKDQETLVTKDDVKAFIIRERVSDNLQQAFDEAGIAYE
ncbi:hypothetical protein HXA34_01780 [Salipaludibacillus agaradhaerens]|uniref:hypothetical protein n=1 Tax=Salipaludibacillus agaradhaerens TaxID=76935 RepID=UPI002151D2B8|nr:hypothetical protein [Salipaludibacillus agaradhaerens]MCR6105014.1 hypothetical protein [Salipaludibacillus agaradhaerens]MCR6117059.1 hypothetical protein [Salipaludibacillus agaradhaerens]